MTGLDPFAALKTYFLRVPPHTFPQRMKGRAVRFIQGKKLSDLFCSKVMKIVNCQSSFKHRGQLHFFNLNTSKLYKSQGNN